MVTDHLRWVSEVPVDGPGRVGNTRRTHKKSRQGCLTCKARRVKCDETRPVCKNCSFRATTCEYGSRRRTDAKSGLATPAASVVNETTAKAPPAARRTDYLYDQLDNVSLASEATLGLDVFATSIAALTRTHATTRTSPNTLPFLLHHFSTASYATLSSHTGQRVIKQQIPSLAVQFPFLLDAIVAFSATHLAYLKQGQTACRPQGGNMSIVAAWHIGRGLRGYGQKIGEFRIGESNPSCNASTRSKLDERKSMDALVATCLILTSLFYHVGWSDEQAQLWSSLWVPETAQLAPHQAQLMPPETTRPNYPATLGAAAPNLNMPPDCVPSRLSATSYSTALRTIKASCEWLTNVTGMLVVMSLSQFREHLPYSIWHPFLAEASEHHANETYNVEMPIHSLGRHQPVEEPLDCETINPPLLTPSTSLTSSVCPSSQNVTLPRLHHLLDLLLPSSHPQLPHPHPRYHATSLHSDLPALLAHLRTLLPLHPADLATFSRIISFPSFFPSDSFPALVAAADPVALLVLGYWFGMLEGVPHWWCRDRGRREGRAVEVWASRLAEDVEAGRWLGDDRKGGSGEETFLRGYGNMNGRTGWRTDGELERRDGVGDMGWGYRRKGIGEGCGKEDMMRAWTAAVKDAVEEFVAWRWERGLGG